MENMKNNKYVYIYICYKCIYINESFCCIPEIKTIL